MTNKERGKAIREELKKACYTSNELGLSFKPFLEKAYQLGKEEVMESWKKAFLHCSSPYCASTHQEVCFSGELGNMEKKECTAKQ